MTILFCKIGWMENYLGQTETDHISGGGSYVKEHGMGHEVCNFAPNPSDGYVYGYVQPTSETINLNRLDKNNNGISVSDVTVVWVATHKVKNKSLGAKIVGWYRNATVFSTFQPFNPVPDLQRENDISRYIIKAPADQAVRLPIDARVITIPRAQEIKGFFGQSNVWYGDAENEKVQEFVQDIAKYIEQYGKDDDVTLSTKTKRAYAQNQEKKVQVEKEAIRRCIQHFEQLGYTVRSVEKDNCGWDLEAEVKKTLLRIEVKGLSGKEFNIGLTPNEYKAFKQQADDYRLAVVTNALEIPKLFICRFSQEQMAWISETVDESTRKVVTEKLAIEEFVSAMVSC